MAAWVECHVSDLRLRKSQTAEKWLKQRIASSQIITIYCKIDFTIQFFACFCLFGEAKLSQAWVIQAGTVKTQISELKYPSGLTANVPSYRKLPTKQIQNTININSKSIHVNFQNLYSNHLYLYLSPASYPERRTFWTPPSGRIRSHATILQSIQHRWTFGQEV